MSMTITRETKAAKLLGSKGGKSKSPAKLAGLAKARAQREANVRAKKDAEALQSGTISARGQS